MYKRTLFRFLALLIIFSMILTGCKTETEEPVVVPTEAAEPATPTEVKAVEPTEPSEPEVGPCPASTVADPMGVPAGTWPEQYDLAEYESLANCKMTFTSRDEFHPDLWTHGFLEGDLPPLEERLPAEPLVVQPYDEIGKYGGLLRMVSIGVEAGNSEYLSVRHVSLVRFLDDHKTIVPFVAKSYEYSDDFTELTFVLRKGHKWSDGHPFTTDDIAFWYNDIILNEELYPSTPTYWVFGGEPMTLEVVDDVTFKFHFAAPAPGFLTFLARAWIQTWQPKHYFEKLHIDYNPDANAVAEAEGLANWVEYFYKFHGDWQDSYHVYGIPKLESHILVEETTEYKIHAANPYFFVVDTVGNQLPYIDEITQSYAPDKELIELKVISGEVDYKSQSIGVTSLPVLQENTEQGNYSIQMPLGAASGRMYSFNCTHQDPILREIFSDPRFSRAMSLALDRDEINKVLCYDLCNPQQGVPVHPTVSFAKPEWYKVDMEYDPDTANDLLDEMGLTARDANGFRLRPDGEPLVIFNVYTQQAGDPTLHELTKEFWEDVGVKVELKEVTTVNYRTLTSTNEHDMGSFYSGGTSEAPLYSNPQPFIPPFGDPALGAMCGGPWYDWYLSGGTSGEEPPDDVRELFDLVGQWKVSIPGSEAYISLGQEMVDIHLEHLWVIGTISESPQPTIISNRLGNVRDITIQAFDYFRTLPYRTYQWYIKE
jgi:peptide/nickel transport system substrate-binding protein